MEHFQGAEFNDLNLNKAYSLSPLYKLLQEGSAGEGPYGFAKRMATKTYGDKHWPCKEIEADSKKYNLTNYHMTRILLEA